MNLKKQQKAAKTRASGAGLRTGNTKVEATHVLVDLKFKSLESLLKNHAESTGVTSGFLAYEPVHDVKTAIISDYLAAVQEEMSTKCHSKRSAKALL